MIPKMRSNKTVGALLWFSMFALITANVSLSSDVNASFTAPCSDVTDFGCDGMVKQDVENNCGSGENKCNAELPSMDDYFAMDFVYCKSDEFRCSDGKCIENVHVCDGNHDCSQGEDEGGLCGVCNVYHCDGECRDLPSGPQCLCPEHMTLAIDGKTCRSENTCDSNEALRCTQLCVKKSNKALCSCSEGYTQNEADCIVEEQFRNGNLFFIDGDKSVGQLSLFNQSNSSSEEFMLPMTASMDYISSLTFETEEQRLYFVGVSDGSRFTGVYRSSDLELKELVFEGIGLRQISYDWVGKNIYYASNGYGIGVCSTNGKHCSHLLAGRKIVPNERAQEYVNLIVHPKRGLLIWLEYNSEHLNGIVMTAGMDGARPRNLVVNAMEKITSIALDYVTDRLYVMEGNELSFVDLQSMQRTTVTRKTPAQAMLFFDGYIYFVSKNKRLSRFKNDTTEFLRPLNGDRFSFAINNTLYYKSMNDPCKALSCSHMCVLSESSEDVAKGKCICPDMYERNSQGVCTYRPHDKPVIKTSEEHMKQMCNEETACLNGGSCGENYNGGPIPSCECASDYSGQYCEIKLAQSYTKQTSGSAWFIVLFVALAVSLFVICYKLRLAAKIRLPFSFNPRTLRGNLATLIGFGQPATTGIRSSPRTLLMNGTSQKDLESAYSSDGIRLMSQLRSFSNPTAMITEQRLDEQVLEQEIQISPDASLLQKPLSSPCSVTRINIHD